MRAVEFDTVIENGKIEVPDKFQNELRGTVHVTISVKKNAGAKAICGN